MTNAQGSTSSTLPMPDAHDLLARMPVAVAWAAPDGRIRYVNHKFTRMFGYAQDDLSTVQQWIQQCYIDPAQALAIDDFWISNHHDDESAEMDGIELDIRCKDGSIKTVLSGKIVLPNHAGALSTFQDITPRKESERLIRRQAMEDELTGLLNRRAFGINLQQALLRSRENSGVALILLDLDGFKRVNDTLGHDSGDLLLKRVAERLRQAVRDGDSLCRIGGDEFCVIVGSVAGVQTATLVADRMLTTLTKPFDVSGNTISIGASIGIALYPQDGKDEHTLFKYADEALYRAKQGGRGRWSR